jgi:hypothetical protein
MRRERRHRCCAPAKYFSSVPLLQRKRTLVFLMTTGHFAHSYVHGTQDWRDTNPDLMKKAVACVTIEHLGALEYLDDEAGNYLPTGKYDWAVATHRASPRRRSSSRLSAGSDAKRVMVRRPFDRYNGEGSGFRPRVSRLSLIYPDRSG